MAEFTNFETYPAYLEQGAPSDWLDYSLAMSAMLNQAMSTYYVEATELDLLRVHRDFLELYIDRMKLDAQDMSEALTAVRYQALTDDRTGMPNNRSLQEYLTSEWRPDNALLAVCVDLEGFKRINDLFGFDYGNGVIVEAAQKLQKVFRSGQVASDGAQQLIDLREGAETVEDEIFVNVIQWSRIGGDEFVALVHLSKDDDVEQVKKSIYERFAKMCIVREGIAINGTQQRISVGFHCGIIASKPDDDADSFYLALTKTLTTAKVKNRQ